jgi:hypothetical protein
MTIRISSQLIGAAAGLGAVAVLAAGCGSSSSSSSKPGAAAGRTQSPIEAAYAYSRCMRQHGVASFPDPQPFIHNGEHGIKLELTPSISGSPGFNTAQHACRAYLPGQQQSQSPAQLQARAQHLLAFANCMRSHNVSNFPDPTLQSGITLEMLQAAAIDVRAPYVIHAAVACLPASDGTLTRADIANAESQAGG